MTICYLLTEILSIIANKPSYLLRQTLPRRAARSARAHCYRNYSSMTESNYATRRNESGVSPLYVLSTQRETILVLRARNRHVITRCGELTNVALMCPRAAYVDLATAACRETRKSLPFNKSCCELPDCATLPGGRNASTDIGDVKSVVSQKRRIELDRAEAH